MTDPATRDAAVARSMWTLFEPVHAVTYFAPEARAATEDTGLRGFWRGYFAGRSAPLGPAGAAVVGASFFSFSPAMVARAVPRMWELISPADALQARLAGAVSALRPLLTGPDSEVNTAADLLSRAPANWTTPAGCWRRPTPHCRYRRPGRPAVAGRHRAARAPR